MPSYPRIKTKNQIAKTVLPQSPCGMNWFYDVNVRSPHGETDVVTRVLPALGDKQQTRDRDPDMTSQLEAERKRVKTLRGQFKSLLTSSQKSNTEKFLDRAKKYIEDAVSIEDGWRQGFFSILADLHVEPFPIDIDFEDIRNGFCIGKYGYESQNIYEPNCPSLDEVVGHDKDVEKWQKLVVAAAVNIRCAEEVIRKAEIKEANRQEAIKNVKLTGIHIMEVGDIKPPAPGVGGIQMGPVTVPGGAPQTMPVDPSAVTVRGQTVMVADGVEEDVGEGEIVEEIDVIEETAPKKKKKKSNAPLIAAVGIGALLLGGKR